MMMAFPLRCKFRGGGGGSGGGGGGWGGGNGRSLMKLMCSLLLECGRQGKVR